MGGIGDGEDPTGHCDREECPRARAEERGGQAWAGSKSWMMVGTDASG